MPNELIEQQKAEIHRESEGNGAPHPSLTHQVEDVALYTVFEKLWAQRRRLGLIVGVFLLAGVVYLLGARDEYTAGAQLMPEEQSETPSIGNLDVLEEFGGLLGGLSAGSLLDKPNALPIQIYPEIAKSTPILLQLLDQQVRSPDLQQPRTLRAYMADHKPFSLWEGIGEGLGALSTLVTGGVPDARTPVVGRDSSIIYLSRSEMKIVEDLQERVTADIDKKTGILHISVTLPDPYISAQVARSAVEALTSYITRYRTNKLEENLAFVQNRYEEAKANANDAMNNLASFRDRNQNLARRLAQTEEERLQAEYDLAFNVYSSLATKLEEAKIKVQEETPVFQVLQPVTLPLEQSRPKTLLVLTLSLLLGVIAAVAIVANDVTWARIRRTFRPN